MPLDFPQSPSEGDIYTFGDRSWTWTGVFWKGTTTNVGYTGSRGNDTTLKGSVPSFSYLDGLINVSVGDAYLVIDQGTLWVWNGTVWEEIGQFTGYTGSRGFTGSRGESTFSWGDTPPENPDIGARWYDTITGCLTVYVDDGDSQQWVEVAASGFVGQQGYTGSAGTGSEPTVIQNFKTLLDTNHTVPTGENAVSVGPITMQAGVTVTVASGQRWVIL